MAVPRTHTEQEDTTFGHLPSHRPQVLQTCTNAYRGCSFLLEGDTVSAVLLTTPQKKSKKAKVIVQTVLSYCLTVLKSPVVMSFLMTC